MPRMLQGWLWRALRQAWARQMSQPASPELQLLWLQHPRPPALVLSLY
jgi:hypothetical protein